MESIDKITFFKNGLGTHLKKNQIMLKIIEKVTQIPKFTDLLTPNIDSELILLICNIIENSVTKKDNINKKDLVIDIFRELGIGMEDQIKHIKNQIEFLHSNKKIKRLKIRERVGIYVYDWIKRKFL